MDFLDFERGEFVTPKFGVICHPNCHPEPQIGHEQAWQPAVVLAENRNGFEIWDGSSHIDTEHANERAD